MGETPTDAAGVGNGRIEGKIEDWIEALINRSCGNEIKAEVCLLALANTGHHSATKRETLGVAAITFAILSTGQQVSMLPVRG